MPPNVSRRKAPLPSKKSNSAGISVAPSREEREILKIFAGVLRYAKKGKNPRILEAAKKIEKALAPLRKAA